jgi:hypothetical protein
VFRIGTEVASLIDGQARPGAVERPDVLVEAAQPAAFYRMFVDRNWAGLTVTGDRALLQRLLQAAAAPNTPAPLPA